MVEVRQSTGAIRIHGVSCLLDGAGTIKLMTYYTSEASPQTDERVVSRRHPRKAPVACIELGRLAESTRVQLASFDPPQAVMSFESSTRA